MEILLFILGFFLVGRVGQTTAEPSDGSQALPVGPRGDHYGSSITVHDHDGTEALPSTGPRGTACIACQTSKAPTSTSTVRQPVGGRVTTAVVTVRQPVGGRKSARSSEGIY